ncbi:unnamed protein product, partial [Prorocentrum cordatum]
MAPPRGGPHRGGATPWRNTALRLARLPGWGRPLDHAVRAELSRAFKTQMPHPFPEAVTNVLAELSRERRPDISLIAIDWLRQQTKCKVNTYHFNAVISAHARVTEWTQALALMDAMAEDAARAAGLPGREDGSRGADRRATPRAPGPV